MEYERYGEDGVRVVFGERIDLEINEKVRRFYLFVRSLRLRGVVEVIPAFCSCLIRFDSSIISFGALVSHLTEKAEGMKSLAMPAVKTYEIPVNYGGDSGPDMAFMCNYSGLTEDEIVAIHTSVTYTVYALGFIPGFPYLGTIDERLYAPRLDTPRIRVPKGSVGIALLQTGIYTFDSPGGWRIIGRTDVPLFDHNKPPYSLLSIGDRVKFVQAGQPLS